MHRRALKTQVAALAVALAIGCGGDDTTAPESILQIGGAWSTFSDGISSSAAGNSCPGSGTMQIVQTGSNYTGTVVTTTGAGSVCTDSFGTTLDNSGTFAITGGAITGSQVTFQVPFCSFTGSISGSPPNAISGTETCTLDVSGQSLTFTGTWQASR